MRPISPWIEKYSKLIPQNGPVLDVACGSGRHSLYLLGVGYDVIVVDIDTAEISKIQGYPNLSIVEADLEKDPWPFSKPAFSSVVVVNYLWRPLFPDLLDALLPGGILLYDTFAQGNERYGRPSNPDFLLAPGELYNLCQGKLEILDFMHGYVEVPKPALRQSIAARKPRE
ncbi:MAG: class I SAM-dependent methyltransferase [Sneathiella sp.]|nr:class I SAM-dependent methyltransferase [Sneathiella sp.]